MPNLISSSRTKQISSATTLEQRSEAKKLSLSDRVLKKIFNFSYLKDKEKVLELVDQITHDTNKTDFKNVEQKLRAFDQLGDLLGKKNKTLLQAKFYADSTTSVDNKLINDYDKSEIILDIAGTEVSILCEKNHLNAHKPEIKSFFNSMRDAIKQDSNKISPAHSMVTNIATEMLDSVEGLYATMQATGFENKTDINESVQKQSGRDFMTSADSLREKVSKFTNKSYSEKINSVNDLQTVKYDLKSLLDNYENIDTPKPMSTIAVLGELNTIKEELQLTTISLYNDLHSHDHKIQDYRDLSNCLNKISSLSKEIDSHLNKIVENLDGTKVYEHDFLQDEVMKLKYLDEIRSIVHDAKLQKKSDGDTYPEVFELDSKRMDFEFKNGDFTQTLDKEKELSGQLKEILEKLNFSATPLETEHEQSFYITSLLNQASFAAISKDASIDISAQFGDEPLSWFPGKYTDGMQDPDQSSADVRALTTKNDDGTLSIRLTYLIDNMTLRQTDGAKEYAPSQTGAKSDYTLTFAFTVTPDLELSIDELSSQYTLNKLPK